MLINDINYLEVVTESNKIEGSGKADLFALLNFDLYAQSDSIAFVSQNADVYADTGIKKVEYSSGIKLTGLT
ncbi:hypothetical protein PCC7424_3516 [Gloeothece citriformis PCC 7424]|uniref:Uncharacterized protein n=1 Tax=Gloeothece citriformis (strain PCC 7424) TaxID=65393 RepID=B7KGI1_GLOC7|nr:hypothetical protein [Gloeothece citriformis]ACK71908.1 hypothetical protein PCC7424_3516 [Gloeothece citriformis PCC 7424]